MTFLPLLLALIGIFAGRQVALKRETCPHRGKVWGSFIMPLLALPVPELQFQALAVSLTSALGAGLTAHASPRVTFVAVLMAGAGAAAGLHFSGY
jgi:hypothetical protein